MLTDRMSPAELRAGASLAGLFGLRMLGLFLILPVFAVHARTLSGGDSRILVGFALGAYGFSQAILQIPFGMASDRFGRKPLITIGLLIFAAGSFLAAAADDIWVVIAGRLLQGAGAISSVVVALAADLTRDHHRGKTMAMIGSMIGFTFALSLIAAPVLYQSIGMGGLFVLVGVLAVAAIAVVYSAVPEAPPRVHAAEVQRGGLAAAGHPELLRLHFGIFVLHLVQIAMFVVVPPLLVEAGLPLAQHWKVYLPVIVLSFALMVPPVMHADRRNRLRPVILIAIALIVVAEALFAGAQNNPWFLAAAMLVFFAAFNVLEALIPSLVSRIAPSHARGTAIGVYNTLQTLGLSVGGLAGGWVAGRWGASAVFGACAGLSLLWLAVAWAMKPVNPSRGGSFTMETNTAAPNS